MINHLPGRLGIKTRVQKEKKALYTLGDMRNRIRFFLKGWLVFKGLTCFIPLKPGTVGGKSFFSVFVFPFCINF